MTLVTEVHPHVPAVMEHVIVKVEAAVLGKTRHDIFASGPGAHGVVLALRHPLKPDYMVVVVACQPVHEVCAGYANPDNCDLHVLLSYF